MTDTNGSADLEITPPLPHHPPRPHASPLPVPYEPPGAVQGAPPAAAPAEAQAQAQAVIPAAARTQATADESSLVMRLPDWDLLPPTEFLQRHRIV